MFSSIIEVNVANNLSLSKYTLSIQDLNPVVGSEISVGLLEMVVIMRDIKMLSLKIEGAGEVQLYQVITIFGKTLDQSSSNHSKHSEVNVETNSSRVDWAGGGGGEQLCQTNLLLFYSMPDKKH